MISPWPMLHTPCPYALPIRPAQTAILQGFETQSSTQPPDEATDEFSEHLVLNHDGFYHGPTLPTHSTHGLARNRVSCSVCLVLCYSLMALLFSHLRHGVGFARPNFKRAAKQPACRNNQLGRATGF
ncbi:hypothetical protein CDD82_3474 [Ophiocordyceps australis]|uniref:Uncharacterized protein n=1 Tax=Ophiocordyceps australis TaxID=1399860 RepID=A0A2C5XP92_9HYPO|nr:hypothetical protein CDD82_3474 [Ophiocordyceps australis]